MNQLKEVPYPTLPCDECLEKEAVNFVPAGGEMVFVYCKHNHVGGSFIGNGCGGGIWNIYTPINEDDFAKISCKYSEKFLSFTKQLTEEAKSLTSIN